MALLAEDLLLLLLDDRRGSTVVDSTSVDYALAGSLLLELALAGRIDVAGEGSSVKKGRLYALDRDPVDDPLLDKVLSRIAVEQRKPESWVPKLAKGLRSDLLRRVEDAGAVRRQDDKVLGVFPRHRFPQADGSGEAAVVEELRRALEGQEPTQRAAALLALLSAVDAVHKVVPGVDKKQARKRAKAISEDVWAASAVASAVRAVSAAVAGAVTASTTAAVISST
ncbi:Golgi phosphoprotein 3 GPP34 [Motilibacter peucedani]|uniref:Golgi phosphoprotein 3 GPP34 n=1 Tax=Motilibacter peucedani TaxID=598650 RepID=A0A420XRS4_9ACTN|nr:GPP34 family phosphoprotein [Motilibacter peucedani]RKS77564.1 Golgi phosphoprotein 3 GPP34 [Motilibacter peucedani]